VAGKADYMSPEQADFQITDKRSDLFSVGVVLGHLLLGKNVFKGASVDESRERVMKMAIPDFRKLDKRLDDKLNNILQRALARELKQRYATADEMLYDMEFYIYGGGYGPTNETLGKFVRELFGLDPNIATREAKGSTRLIERTSRITRTVKRDSRTASTRNTKKSVRLHR